VAKRVIFQLHWFLGITAGLVLALMGVTGASMSFEDEINEALSPRLYAPGVINRADLSPDQIIARVEADNPGYYVSRLDWEVPRARSHGVRLAAKDGPGRKQGRIDRTNAVWLGEPVAADFFQVMDDLHRWLALPGGGNGIGRQITGFSAIALIFFALSGLYLRWPRRALDWRAWLVLDVRMTGRNLWRALHVVIGTWIGIFYLLSALTGLWWSYDWYRRGVTYALTGKTGGEEGEGRGKSIGPALRPAIDPAWRAFRRATGDDYVWVRIARPKPSQTMQSISFDARAADARHLRQFDRFSYDPATAALKKRDLYDRRPLGVILTQSMFELHRGAFFGLPGRIVMLLTSLTMPLFTITGYLLYLSRRRRKRDMRALGEGACPSDGAGDIVIAYASQTGHAEMRARNAALALVQGGVQAQVVPIGKLRPDMLASTNRLLLVVSTYGDGEPPDMARGFARHVLAHDPPDLGHLHYGLLALGDREYPHFCGFGRQVDGWFATAGAVPLFSMIAMDAEDMAADTAWQTALQDMGAGEGRRGQTIVPFTPWTLVARTLLNPGSPAAGAFHLQFEPADQSALTWEAGDIVEIEPGDPAAMAAATMLRSAATREYSAASIPADGTLDLVVRQVRDEGGRLGLGSGWLTAHLPVGSTTLLRLRANPAFHVDRAKTDTRLILIGNGTGIAGLRAHLRAQAQAGSSGHWLFFGERSRAHERFFDGELSGWLADGLLARADRCYSRDADCGRYVQQMVQAEARAVTHWVDQGATILVCGSLHGMAQGVHAALATMLGEAALDRLAEEGRYRRDIY